MREQQAFTYNSANQLNTNVPLRAHRQDQQGHTTTAAQQTKSKPSKAADDTAFRVPGSQLRHRPIGKIYVIPMSDGTELHVTERELEDLPEDYQNAAQLVSPQLAAPAVKNRRQPHPQTPNVQTPDVIYAPAARGSKKRSFVRAHWLLFFGVGMLFMLALWVTGQMIVSFVGTKLDDMTYGYPRTFQIDAVVGHNNDSPANPSHFIFINLNRHIEVIEEPAGDPTKMQVHLITTLFGEGDNLTPVTGYFKDVNHDGKPDMIVKLQDSRIVFINTGTSFRPLKPGEKVNI